MLSPCIEHVVLLESDGAAWAARPRWQHAEAWRAQQRGEPLAACASLLEQTPRGRLRRLDRATVLLGFPHVHYLLLPWQAGLYSQPDWQGFARAMFSEAGIDPQQYQVQVADAAFGAGRIAVATRLDLLEDLRALFALKTLTLQACVPLLTATLQHYWERLPDDCVLAVPQDDALSCLYLHQGQATQVCAVPTRPGASLSDSLLTVELLLQAHAQVICIATQHPVETDAPGQWLGPVHPWLQEPGG